MGPHARVFVLAMTTAGITAALSKAADLAGDSGEVVVILAHPPDDATRPDTNFIYEAVAASGVVMDVSIVCVRSTPIDALRKFVDDRSQPVVIGRPSRDSEAAAEQHAALEAEDAGYRVVFAEVRGASTAERS